MPSVRFTARELPAGSTRRDFGRTLFLFQGDDAATDLDQITRERQLRRYGNAQAVNDDWPAGSPVRDAAAAYFAQVPFPGPLLTGAWFDTDVVGRVLGSSTHSAANQLAALGTFTLSFGATTTGNIDFSSVTTFAGAATAIQAALSAVSTGATCAYSAANSRFECTFAAGANIAGGFADNAASRALGLFSAVVLPGIEAEANVATAAARLNTDTRDWFGVYIDPALAVAQRNAMKTWAAANGKFYGYEFSDTGALTTNETTSEGAVDFGNQQDGVFGFWTQRADRKALRALGAFASVDFRQPGSYFTLDGKVLDGAGPDTISETGQEELERKRINFYVPNLGKPGLVHGGITYGTWMDHYVFIQWVKDAIEVAMGDLQTRARYIPQDDRGRALVIRELDVIGTEARAAGGLSPGTVSEAFAAEIRQTTGNPDFDGTMREGYIPHVGEFTPSIRQQGRILPPTTFFGRFTGAVHDIEGTIVFGV